MCYAKPLPRTMLPSDALALPASDAQWSVSISSSSSSVFIVDTILIPAITLSIAIFLSSVLLLVITLLLLITTRNRNILLFVRVFLLLKICGLREYTSGHKPVGRQQHKCSECSTPKAGMTTDIECFGQFRMGFIFFKAFLSLHEASSTHTGFRV